MLGEELNNLQGGKNNGMIKLRRALKLPQNASFAKTLKIYRSAENTITGLQNRRGTHKLGFRFIRPKKIMSSNRNKNETQECNKWHKHNIIINRISLHLAINEKLFHQLEKRVSKMYAKKKICILQFQDINLTSHLRRVVRRSNIYHHALLFTVQGVKTHYVQPVSYIFCSSTTPAIDLSTQIKLMISKLQDIGLTVIATVCNCSSLSVNAINWLIRGTATQYRGQTKLEVKKTFEINGAEIIPLYDPSHLIKELRNDLIDHNLKFQLDGEEKVSKWEHVVKLYDKELGYKGYRLLPLLTKKHVRPNRILQSNVKSAIELINSDVGAVMFWIMNLESLTKECTNTALLFLFFGNLYESLNKTYLEFNNRSRKPRLGLIAPNSTRKEIWAESKNILKSMKFCISSKSIVLPSIYNWLQTVENMEYLVEMLLKEHKVTVERWKKFKPFIAQPKELKKSIRAINSYFRSQGNHFI